MRLSSKKFEMTVGPGTMVLGDVGYAAHLDIETDFEIKKDDLEIILGDKSVEPDKAAKPLETPLCVVL